MLIKDMSLKRMAEPFSNMINHITELIGFSDAYDTLAIESHDDFLSQCGTV